MGIFNKTTVENQPQRALRPATGLTARWQTVATIFTRRNPLLNGSSITAEKKAEPPHPIGTAQQSFPPQSATAQPRGVAGAFIRSGPMHTPSVEGSNASEAQFQEILRRPNLRETYYATHGQDPQSEFRHGPPAGNPNDPRLRIRSLQPTGIESARVSPAQLQAQDPVPSHLIKTRDTSDTLLGEILRESAGETNRLPLSNSNLNSNAHDIDASEAQFQEILRRPDLRESYYATHGHDPQSAFRHGPPAGNPNDPRLRIRSLQPTGIESVRASPAQLQAQDPVPSHLIKPPRMSDTLLGNVLRQSAGETNRLPLPNSNAHDLDASEAQFQEILRRPDLRESYYAAHGQDPQSAFWQGPPAADLNEAMRRIQSLEPRGIELLSESRSLLQQQDPVPSHLIKPVNTSDTLLGGIFRESVAETNRLPLPNSNAYDMDASEAQFQEILRRPNLRESYYATHGHDPQSEFRLGPLGENLTEEMRRINSLAPTGIELANASASLPQQQDPLPSHWIQPWNMNATQSSEIVQSFGNEPMNLSANVDGPQALNPLLASNQAMVGNSPMFATGNWTPGQVAAGFQNSVSLASLQGQPASAEVQFMQMPQAAPAEQFQSMSGAAAQIPPSLPMPEVPSMSTPLVVPGSN